MTEVLLIIFIFSLGTFVLLLSYPLITYLRALLIKKPIDRSNSFIKPVSVVIAAYNEELLIREKINFFLLKDEWIPGSEIIVVSAGSTDGTNKILSEFESLPQIKVIIIEHHLVKPLALNFAVAQCKNDILIFSDCRQIIKPKSIPVLVSYFNDPEIGVVNSTISDKNKNGKTSFIRSILNSICINDSVSGSSLNIHGALYAQRRTLFKEFPNDILFDDLFAIVSTIIQNKRIIQIEEVIIIDLPINNYYNKNRIERLSRGLLIFLFRYWKDIKKLPTTTLWRFILYRYFKLLLPYLTIGIIVPSLYFLYPFATKANLIVTICIAIILFSIKNTRNFILLAIRINYSFMSSAFKYFFMNERETKWEKLSSEQTLTKK